ncbi:hypothetical protein [Microbacterium sp. NPDC087665]|uniref:hypothetical protein n=1 Tax=Microbacterium sp. NPDC087665 TaxID=3364194 RepID=UPI003825D01B
MIFVGLAIGLSSAIVAVMLRLPRESPALRTHEYELEPHMHRVLLDGVGRILDEAAHYLPAESLVLARQIFERGEGSNTLDELAWVIVRHEQPVPSSLIRSLRACFVELAPTDVLPAALDKFAIERADGEADDSAALVELGALVEFSSKSMIAVDARDQPHAQIVADYLLAAERDFGVVYETSRSGSESGGGAR